MTTQRIQFSTNIAIGIYTKKCKHWPCFYHLCHCNFVYGSLGSRNTPPPVLPAPAPRRGWARRLAVAPESCPAWPGWPPAVAACWAVAARAASWNWRLAAAAAWWLVSCWCWLAPRSGEAGRGHLNLGIPMRPSWGMPGMPGTPAPGTPWTTAPGIPGSPPTSTPPPAPTPSIAATERG